MSKSNKEFLFDVRRDHNGALMATSFEVSMCDQCQGAHVDLLNNQGSVFATAKISPESFMEIAAKFVEFSHFVNGKSNG